MEQKTSNERFPMKSRHMLWIVPLGTLWSIGIAMLFYGAVNAINTVSQWLIGMMQELYELATTNIMALAALTMLAATVGSAVIYMWVDRKGRWMRIKHLFTSKRVRRSMKTRPQSHKH